MFKYHTHVLVVPQLPASFKRVFFHRTELCKIRIQYIVTQVYPYPTLLWMTPPSGIDSRDPVYQWRPLPGLDLSKCRNHQLSPEISEIK
jgi:hypothetical protein